MEHRRRLTALVASAGLLVAAPVLLVAAGMPAAPDSQQAQRDTKLYLGGIGELTIVDVQAETSRTNEMPEIGAGDPPYLIAPVGQRLAMWSYDVTSVPFDRPKSRPTMLARNAWIFVPSANPDAIWTGYLGPRPNRERRLDELREIDSRGRILLRGVDPPHGRWPFASLTSGLLFYGPRSMKLWSPHTERTIRSIATRKIGDPGPVHGDVLASCGSSCRRVTLTDFASGEQRRIGGVGGSRLVSFEAAFSPDGSKLAVPVLRGHRGWRSYSERGRRLAIVNVEDGRTLVVPRSHVPPGYVFTGWSRDGRQAIIAGGLRRRGIVAYTLGRARGDRIAVDVEGFYEMVAR
jgi:hypothetical protein